MAAARKKKPAADDRAVVAPSVRTFTDWTTSRLKVAAIQADSGNLRAASDVCSWILTDEAVAGALSARTQSLLGLVPTFEPAGDKRRSSRAVKALEAGEDWWTAYPESELEQLLTWGLLLGAAPARHYWQAIEGHDGRMLPMPEVWPTQTLRFDFLKQGWFIRDANNVEMPLVPGDSEWILHTPFGKNRPWTRGLWLSLGRWVLFKALAVEDWSHHSEKGSILVGTTPEGGTKKMRDELARDLSNCGADAAAVLSAGCDLKLLEVAANTRQIYEAQIELANKAIAIRIRGGNLTTDVQQGSRAAAETQAANGGDQSKLRFDAETLSTTLHDQSITWWAEFNFGDSKLAPYPVWPVEPEEDKQAKAETAKTMGEAAQLWDGLGYDLDDKVLREDYGLDFLKARKSPEQRAADKAAAAPPAPDQKPSEAPEEGDNAKASARSIAPRILALASGAVAKGTTGFVEGQLYVDSLTETSAGHATKALKPTTDAILSVLDSIDADSRDPYGDLRAKLHDLYADLDPSELSALVEKSMVLAELAGRTAVLQDL